MNYSPQTLHAKLDAALSELASSRHFLIGLSGGLDSLVLLRAMVALRDSSGDDIRLRALHINHQLHEEADRWQRHCAQLCEDLGVEFAAIRVSIDGETGIENAARDARYREFEAALQEGEELLLAHHRDDQMETLLLRLVRGAGSRGLSGMPRSRQLGRNRLLRPLLDIDRAELQQYGDSVGLDWVEDPSNAEQLFDRNYCRQTLLPAIEARWPGYRESWSKSAVLAAESEALMQDLAAIDLAAIVGDSPAIVNRGKLLALSELRRRNVLRHWLASLGIEDLGWNRLQQLSRDIIPGSGAKFNGADFELHCFRDAVYVLDAAALQQGEPAASDVLVSEHNLTQDLPLPNNGSLSFRRCQGEGLALQGLPALSIRYRQGGEACRLAGRPSKTLKKILQEVEMPPWLRERMPLLYSGDALVYIPGIGVSEEFAANGDEAACLIDWQQPDLTRRR